MIALEMLKNSKNWTLFLALARKLVAALLKLDAIIAAYADK
jgi:hypothetical protein